MIGLSANESALQIDASSDHLALERLLSRFPGIGGSCSPLSRKLEVTTLRIPCQTGSEGRVGAAQLPDTTTYGLLGRKSDVMWQPRIAAAGDLRRPSLYGNAVAKSKSSSNPTKSARSVPVWR